MFDCSLMRIQSNHQSASGTTVRRQPHLGGSRLYRSLGQAQPPNGPSGSTWGSAGPAAPLSLEPTLALRGSRGQGWVFRGRPRPPLQGRASGRRAPTLLSRVTGARHGDDVGLVGRVYDAVDQPRQPVERIGFLRDIIVSVVDARDARYRVAEHSLGDVVGDPRARQ